MNTSAPAWSLDTEALLTAFETTPEGLSEQEAQKRLAVTGPNSLPLHNANGPIVVFLKQLKDPLIIILCCAGLLTFFLREWVETIVIIAAIFANATMGFWQEWKAQTVLEKLKNFVVVRTRVRRNGHEQEREAKDLVPGDIVILRAGDRVPADIRLITETGFKTDEAILTGESVPVEKHPIAVAIDAETHERVNIAMSGTLVTDGQGEGIVVATGSQTVFGSIAALTAAGEEVKTPLQQSVQKLSLKIGAAAFIITALVFGVGLSSGTPWDDMVLLAIAIGVSLVPEGLPIAMSVILAVGVERLANKKGVVRKLSAAEALGSTTLILTDKTGTLTRAILSLERIESANKEQILELASLASTAAIENPDQPPERWRIIGSPVDTAIIRAAGLNGIDIAATKIKYATFDQLPFTHERKYSATLVNHEGQPLAVMIGAPDILSSLCTNGPSVAALETMAKNGARLIGIATQNQTAETFIEGAIDGGTCTYLGTLAFEDPLRPDIKDSVTAIREAGVRTVMVTGDHPQTAAAMALQAGIATAPAQVMVGAELAKLSDEELKETIQNYHAFARVTPEQKWRLVQIYQSLGEAVAVTGDGVNDAPALRIADVGVAMGSGTDVAKDAADIVILDDSYPTIVGAIREGRQMLNNIQKATTYLFSNAFNDVLLVLGSYALGIPSPLNALQILYANFFTDSFPAIGYAFETMEDDGISKREPQKHDDVLGPRLRKITFIAAAANGAVLLTGYWIVRQFFGDHEARTIGFASMGLSHIFVAIAFRSLHLPVQKYWLKGNRVFLAGISIGVVLIGLAIYLPILNIALDTTPLSPLGIIIFVSLAALASVPAELSKHYIKQKTAR